MNHNEQQRKESSNRHGLTEKAGLELKKLVKKG